MRFNLRFLFVLTTIVAVVVSVVVMKRRHQAALELHRENFSALIGAVGSLPESLPPAIRGMPGVLEQLQRANPLAPGNALTGGHSGSSSGGLIGRPMQVHYRFHYYFPADKNGVASDETTAKVIVHSEVDWELLGRHNATITYHPNDLSRQAARHIQAELTKTLRDYLQLKVVEQDISDL